MDKLAEKVKSWDLEKLVAGAFAVGGVIGTVLSLSMGHLYIAIPLALAGAAYLKVNADQQRLACQPCRAADLS
jgi:uncharacterized membrane protein YoaK (UPF0700 family)